MLGESCLPRRHLPAGQRPLALTCLPPVALVPGHSRLLHGAFSASLTGTPLSRVTETLTPPGLNSHPRAPGPQLRPRRLAEDTGLTFAATLRIPSEAGLPLSQHTPRGHACASRAGPSRPPCYCLWDPIRECGSHRVLLLYSVLAAHPDRPSARSESGPRRRPLEAAWAPGQHLSPSTLEQPVLRVHSPLPTPLPGVLHRPPS